MAGDHIAAVRVLANNDSGDERVRPALSGDAAFLLVLVIDPDDGGYVGKEI